MEMRKTDSQTHTTNEMSIISCIRFLQRGKYTAGKNEVRATVNLARKKQLALNHSPNGCFIKADLRVLIDSIWVHPQATEDFRHRVEILLNDSPYREIPIHQSSWEAVEE